ncbi:MAG: hypothetical protein KDA84_27380, partial [Planctomycetaceae bacterium]|nr:hypothetical protein [Planctomycetaceae bacterium]
AHSTERHALCGLKDIEAVQMLAIHWSPVKNTKSILRNISRKGKRGLFCFPLTGHEILDRCWAWLFRCSRSRPRTPYNGFVFRLTEDDLPASFGDWILDACGQARSFGLLSELEEEFRRAIVSQMETDRLCRQRRGSNRIRNTGEGSDCHDSLEFNQYRNDPMWMQEVFYGSQIILSKSIDARRIIRIVSYASKSGRRRVNEHRSREGRGFA